MSRDGSPMTMTFGEYDWSAIQHALYEAAGELAASEARRTGGRGIASGGKARELDRLHRIQDEIRAAKPDPPDRVAPA